MSIAQSTKPVYFLCLILSTFMALSIDICLPSLPSITQTFNATGQDVQFTLNIFLLGFAISQIFYGPIADCYGKRDTLLIGLVVYLLSSIGCIFAISINMLIFFRIIQSFGACSASVSAYALARDNYDGKNLTRILANMGIIMTIVPSLAPLVGSIINNIAGWRFIFVILFIISLATIIYTVFSLPVEKNKPLKKLFIQDALSIYFSLIQDHSYIYYTIISTSIFSALYFFICASPFLFIYQLHVSKIYYGIIMAISALALALGNQLSKSTDNTYTTIISLTFCTTFIFISAIMMMIFSINYSILSFSPMLLCSISIGIIFPITTAAALKHQKKRSGQASALAGFIRFSSAMIISTLLTPTFNNLIIIIFLCGIINILCLLSLRIHYNELNYEN